MRSPVPALLLLADSLRRGAPMRRSARPHEPAPLHRLPPPHGAAQAPSRIGSGAGLPLGVGGVAAAPRIGGDEPGLHLTVEVAEAIVRRYQGRPPRIDNPFAAFPTRAFWLGQLMHGERSS